MKKLCFLALIGMLLLTAFTPYKEPYRPQIHYTPYENWMNDPNGLVFDEETGMYHMFYQYCQTLKEDQSQKYWGHASSTDLVHWEEQNVVLAPDNYGSVWSGSCVIDRNNTSGLFDDNTPAGSRMVAFFTYAGGDTKYGFEKQGLAYSIDHGKTFTKYQEPIIKNGNNEYPDGFRDPKVIWHEESKTWIMVIGGGAIRLFTSKNLIDWEFNSILKYRDGSNISAECPDLFPMEVENEIKWVFFGAGRFYVVGDLIIDNNKYLFKAITDKQTFLPINTPMYAAQTFFNDKKNRRIAIYWLIDLYSQSVDESMSKIWDGVQSLSLELKLYKADNKYVLKANPVEELLSLRDYESTIWEDVLITPTSDNILENVSGRLLEIEVVLNVEDAGRTNISFLKGNEEKTVLTYNAKSQNLSLVMKDSGISSETTSIKVPPEEGKIKLRIIIDNTVVNVFANDGICVLNGHMFSSEISDKLEFSVQDGNTSIESLEIYKLVSIWDKPNVITNRHRSLDTLDYILIVAIAAAIVSFVICVIAICIKKVKKKEGI